MLKTWERDGYTVEEKHFDYDLHQFDIIKDGETIATITPGSIEEMEETIAALDAGEGVDGWEDGMGNTIRI